MVKPSKAGETLLGNFFLIHYNQDLSVNLSRYFFLGLINFIKFRDSSRLRWDGCFLYLRQSIIKYFKFLK